MPRTSAMCRKAEQGKGNTHITQDMVRRAILVLPGHSCIMSFAIEAMSKAISTLYVHVHVCMNTLDWCYRCFCFVRGLTLQLHVAILLPQRVYAMYISDRS